VLFCVVLTADLSWIFGKFPMTAQGRMFSAASLPVAQVPVLILGAGVLPDREPTQVLQSRLDTGLDLFREGKASWFLVSGDNRAANYNEPQAMRRWLLRRGVPPRLVISDFAGRRTYDSLKRAQAVFGVRKVIIVTSDFHLARALFLARHLGLDAYGVPASTEVMSLRQRIGFWFREYRARHLATWDAWFPPATMLGPREATPDDPAQAEAGTVSSACSAR
jgi:vancomycin permeability regulator SanA